MKKVGPQTIIRKVFTNNVAPSQTHPQHQQVKRVNSLLPSTQSPKIVTRKVAPVFQSQQNTSPYHQQNSTKCFVCDEVAVGSLTSCITEVATTTTQTKLPNKIAKVVGDSFMVIVAHDDVICRRCLGLFNQMDKIESELERVKTSIKNFLSKKYSISDDDQPPAKLQKLNSGFSSRQEEGSGATYTRKIIVSGKETIESQLKNIYETNNSTHNSTSSSITSPTQAPVKRQPIKLYKCVSCDFKTTDLNAFQPHYEVCKGSSTNSASTQQNTTSAFRCKICKKLFASIMQLNRHTQEVHVRQNQDKGEDKVESQQIGATTISQVYACNMCQYKTNDKTNYDDHLRKHIKLKPFKCRLCLMRFETREQATVHAKTHTPAYFKCGICELAFNKREHLMEHLNTHENTKTVNQQEVIAVAQPGSTQKLLQDSINEALRVDDSSGDPKNSIQFHSCAICSVTFLNELLYTQHMKVHGPNASETASETVRKPQMAKYTKGSHSNNSIKEKHALTEDLESILNKMHSDNSGQTTNGTSSDSNVLITTQESSSGGITYNITIPQDDQTHEKPSIGIDMPNLDHEDSQEKSDTEHQLPVSMPSLDEDEQQSQTSQEEQQEGDQAIPMELDDLQNATDGQQIKFILDENGQILQLDNHILTTDADGNQILVQGSDGEHLQQLLQSVGMVMQGADGEEMEGDGEHQTLQMLDDGSGQSQMILVQGADGEEPRLIDASMLQHEGGNLVLQQNENGETFLTTADGTPVSVSSSMEPGMGGEGQITVMAGGEEGQQYVLQQMGQEGEAEEGEMELQSQESQGDEQEKHEESQEEETQIMSQGEEDAPQAPIETQESDEKVEEKVDQEQNESAENTTTTATGDGFFNLGDEQDIMQPAEETQEQKEEQ